MAARVPLTAEELVDLDAALIEAYRLNAAQRMRSAIARHIARPAIPAAFSESLVAAATPALFGPGASAAFGGKDADLQVELGDGQSLLVEVKATGLSAFQELKARDLARDALVWVHFGARYVDGEGPIEIYLLPQPGRYKPPRRKLPLSAFLAGASGLAGFRAFRFEQLSDAFP